MSNQQNPGEFFKALDRISKLEKKIQGRDQISLSEQERVTKNATDIKTNRDGVNDINERLQNFDNANP